jgi:hypothetical protein
VSIKKGTTKTTVMAAATAIRQKKVALARMANAELDANLIAQAKQPDRWSVCQLRADLLSGTTAHDMG